MEMHALQYAESMGVDYISAVYNFLADNYLSDIWGDETFDIPEFLLAFSGIVVQIGIEEAVKSALYQKGALEANGICIVYECRCGYL